jgi:N-acetylglutamate synthase-like GNAT family acetyltransferase
MDNKKAIIDEVLDTERIYINENATMEIRTVNGFTEIPEHCSKCKEPLEEIYIRPEDQVGINDYVLVVLKCENCSTFYSFWIEPATFDDTYITPTKEDMKGREIEPPEWEYKRKTESGKRKHHVFSKKIADSYKKAIRQLEDIDKKVTLLLQSKQEELYAAGLSKGTIYSARNKVINCLKNNTITLKQLNSLLAAAIYEASREEYIGANGYRRIGEKIGECQLEKIFGVTRKTIRRWRKLLTAHSLAKIG